MAVLPAGEEQVHVGCRCYRGFVRAREMPQSFFGRELRDSPHPLCLRHKPRGSDQRSWSLVVGRKMRCREETRSEIDKMTRLVTTVDVCESIPATGNRPVSPITGLDPLGRPKSAVRSRAGHRIKTVSKPYLTAGVGDADRAKSRFPKLLKIEVAR